MLCVQPLSEQRCKVQHVTQEHEGMCRRTGRAAGKAAATADAVTLGDAWLGPAIQQGLLQPIPHALSSPWWVSPCTVAGLAVAGTRRCLHCPDTASRETVVHDRHFFLSGHVA